MNHAVVSVVIPVYNGARYLATAIDSALAQTYTPLEVVVVNDGSTDSSHEVIASYGGRVRSVSQPNQGVAAARNAGIALADGEFIAFLDQDDCWLPGKVAAQVKCFELDPRLGLVHTGIRQFSDPPGSVGPIYRTEGSARLVGDCYDRLLLGNGVFNSSVMVRKAVLEETGPFDPSIPGNTVQDYDLWLRIARRYPFAYIPEELTALRLHEGQGTWDRRAMLGDELGVLGRHLSPGIDDPPPAMRARVAALFDELGVAHLDARDARAARRCFFRELCLRRSMRATVLWALCHLPVPVIARLRRARDGWRKGRTRTP
jgi:glycosyltransferase involved in cell wall biosynthesis